MKDSEAQESPVNISRVSEHQQPVGRMFLALGFFLLLRSLPHKTNGCVNTLAQSTCCSYRVHQFSVHDI